MVTRLYIVFFMLITALLTAQNSLIRMPRISPNAKEVAFSYQGDIWIHNFNTKQSKRVQSVIIKLLPDYLIKQMNYYRQFLN